MARKPNESVLSNDEIHAIVFNTFGIRRFLQDGPIRPDVWERFLTLAARSKSESPQSGDGNKNTVSLILTPKSSRAIEGQPAGRATELTMALARRLMQRTSPPVMSDGSAPELDERFKNIQREFRMAATSRYVVIDVTFETLITDLLPLTDWWRSLPQSLTDHKELRKKFDEFAGSPKSIMELLREQQYASFYRFVALAALTAFLSQAKPKLPNKALTKQIDAFKRILAPETFERGMGGSSDSDEVDPDDLMDWQQTKKAATAETSLAVLKPLWDSYIELIQQSEFTVGGWQDVWQSPALSSRLGATVQSDTSIWAIQRNRRATRQVGFSSPIPNSDVAELSRNTVKADAAWRLFAMSTASLVWGVVDTGIDSLHPAFCNKSIDGLPLIDNDGTPVRDHDGKPLTSTQVVKEDLTSRFRWDKETDLLLEKKPDGAPFPCWVSEDLNRLIRREQNWLVAYDRKIKLEETDYCNVKKSAFLQSRVRASLDFTKLRKIINGEWTVSELMDRIPWAQLNVPQDDDARRQYLAKTIDRIRRHNLSGRELDWSLIEPLIRIDPYAQTSRPSDPHGTHVAGIIAGDLPAGVPTDKRPFFGVCPDIQLYDIRVFSDDGQDGGDEFTVLAALDYITWVNRDPERPGIHGVNLSLAIRHVVDAHACGGTPVCDAANRMVWAGTVVVAAAGNFGFDQRYVKASLGIGYRGMSIADPGNAEQVITVGATHRSEPHTYGVSYFSSRGPTGDGRVKPDLVAPGEKIRSCVPGQIMKVLDGTSMAAPHVSGVCAMLMARHTELIAEPIRIKHVLTRTATDLGRERYFQGAGLVDALRALQSI